MFFLNGVGSYRLRMLKMWEISNRIIIVKKHLMHFVFGMKLPPIHPFQFGVNAIREEQPLALVTCT